MVGGNKFKYVIIGFGPSGLSVLDQLLISGAAPHEIAIIGINEDPKTKQSSLSLELYSKRDPIKKAKELKAIGIKKRGIDTASLMGPTQSLANFWGASHLPPIYLGKEYDKFFPRRNIENAILAGSRMFQIQEVTQEKLKDEFPTCGEIGNGTLRKQISCGWAENTKNNFIHSRLSLGGHRQSVIACSNKATCFEHCPSGAFWSPSKELQQLILKNPEISVFYGQVNEVDSERKMVSMKDSISIFFEKLFLCAGPKNSIEILRNSKIVGYEVNFRYSPVVMLPFLLPKVDENDYRNTHVLADLLAPFIKGRKIEFLAQVYFPTENLASNIFSRLPVPFLQCLDLLPKQLIDVIARRIGIAMCFLEDVPFGDSKLTVRKSLREYLGELKAQMKNEKARLLQIAKVYALDGLSYHTGSVFLTSDPANRGLNSEIFVRLKTQGIYLADGLALTRIPPGPHTNTVCMIARCLVMEVVTT